MSEYWQLHCKTCDMFTCHDINHGDNILRAVAKAAPLIKALHEAECEYIDIDVSGYQHTDFIPFILEHSDHALELESEYGKTEPIEKAKEDRTNISDKRMNERHIGYIHVPMDTLSDVLSIMSTDTQGELKDRGVFERVHELMLLPDSYKIIAIFRRSLSLDFEVFVENESIPLVEIGYNYPEVQLWYQRRGDGTDELADIKVRFMPSIMSFTELMRARKEVKDKQAVLHE